MSGQTGVMATIWYQLNPSVTLTTGIDPTLPIHFGLNTRPAQRSALNTMPHPWAVFVCQSVNAFKPVRTKKIALCLDHIGG